MSKWRISLQISVIDSVTHDKPTFACRVPRMSGCLLTGRTQQQDSWGPKTQLRLIFLFLEVKEWNMCRFYLRNVYCQTLDCNNLLPSLMPIVAQENGQELNIRDDILVWKSEAFMTSVLPLRFDSQASIPDKGCLHLTFLAESILASVNACYGSYLTTIKSRDIDNVFSLISVPRVCRNNANSTGVRPVFL